MTEAMRLRSQEHEAGAVRKALARLVPFLAFLYMFNILDRGNVSVAALTMQKDLKFSDAVYGFGAGIFFVGYFFFEVPSNLIMQKVGARRWICRIMLSWGTVSTCMMFVRSPFSFYAMRFLLGLAEAGFFPGIILYLTYWFPAGVRAKVMARFLALSSVLGLASGPIGGLILKFAPRGHGELAGWQWLFLLEGIPSVLLGFVVLKFLPDGPAKADWLLPEEKQALSERLAEDAKQTGRVEHLSVRVALSNPKIRLMCAIFILSSTAGNAVGFFGPKLIQLRSGGLWTDAYVSTIGIIPALVGAIAMVLAAVHSDRTGRRRRHVAVGYMVAGLGFVLCVFTHNAPLTLAALSLNALGERTAAGSYWALTSTLMGTRAAAGGIAFINSVGNMGGFFGPILMGKLLLWNGGNYAMGLYAAGGLFLLGGALSCFLSNPRRSPDYALEEPPV